MHVAGINTAAVRKRIVDWHPVRHRVSDNAHEYAGLDFVPRYVAPPSSPVGPATVYGAARNHPACARRIETTNDK